MYNFNNNIYNDDKVIINCRKCSQKLRVPKDAGKLSVTCPICKTEFLFNPNDIIYKATSYIKNTFYSWKRNLSNLKMYKSVIYQMLKNMNNRYKR